MSIVQHDTFNRLCAEAKTRGAIVGITATDQLAERRQGYERRDLHEIVVTEPHDDKPAAELARTRIAGDLPRAAHLTIQRLAWNHTD